MSIEIAAGDCHPNLKLLSNSSDNTLHACPRKFELYKLLPQHREEGDRHTDFGHLVGYGVAAYFLTNDIQKTAVLMFASWKGELDTDDEDTKKDKKTFWHALYAVDKFIAVRQSELASYDLCYFQDKPAIELGFSIDIGDGFFYRGLIDTLLIDTPRKVLRVFECKTTKFRKVHEATYKHSSQALGYSLVIDAVTKLLGFEISDDYTVMYHVYKSGALEWETFRFKKSHTDRALWINDVLLDKEKILEYAQLGYFPKYGRSCYDFFRPCTYFDMCEFSNNILMPKGSEVKVEKEDKYQFKFKLEELIAAQLERIGG